MKFVNLFSKEKKPVVYLHIGMNKTGTTALQKYMNQNYMCLRSNGVLYPKSCLIDDAHYTLSSSLGFCNPSAPKEWIRDLSFLKKQIETEITSNIRSVIFSSEDFVLNKSVDIVRDFFDGFSVKIIVYLRRHDYWWVSAYTQAVKMKQQPPWNLGPQGFINYYKRNNKFYGDYRFLVDRWSKVFGRDNVIVRPYESIQNKPNIACDFFDALGLESVARKLSPMLNADNKSLPLYSVQVMDVFQRIKVDPLTNKKLIGYANNIEDLDERKVIDLLNPQFRIDLLKSYQSDYDYIAKTFLGRNDGVLFNEPLPDSNPGWVPPKWPSSAKVAELAIKAVCN